jgi:hypothetical protein
LKGAPVCGVYVALACAGGTMTIPNTKTDSAITARKSFFIKN